MNFVNVKIYNKVKRIAIHEGLDTNLLSHHKASLNRYRGKQHIPLNLLFEIYEMAQKNLSPGFSLRIGASMIPEDYGTLGLSWKTCWKARDFFERFSRYIILITNKGIFELNDVGDQSQFSLKRDVNRLGQAMSNEATFAMCIKIIKSITNKEIRPNKVTFRHDISRDNEPYITYFKCPVEFSQSTNSIWFTSTDLEVKTILADRSINTFLIERMNEEKKGIEITTKSITSDVSGLIRNALPSGIPNINDIGHILGMSQRTLTRRLSDYGVTFRDLIKKTQESISKDLLENTDLSVGEIAFQTGYSEQSAFNRAFKRWTGQSPIEYRKL